MRNKYFSYLKAYSVALLILLALGSCKKFLEPDSPSLSTTAEVFSSVYTARMAVLGVYQDLAGDQGYGIRLSMYFPYDNDETMGPNKVGDNDRGDIAHYTLTPGNLQLYAPYVQLYQGIERANLCIYNIPKMSLYIKGNAQLKRLLGEAYTLRAQFYLELIRNWGDVPAQFLPSEVSSNLFIGKTNRDTIYNHLLNDLLIAESLVPWRKDLGKIGDPQDERITQGAVRALRARIALYRGGYDLRQNGTISRDANYKYYYQIAWNECDSIINDPAKNHGLNTDYKSLFKNYLCANQPDPNSEIMFKVSMGGGTGLTDSKLGLYNGPKFGLALSSYTSKVDPCKGTTSYTTTFTTVNGSASIFMLPTYFYLFDKYDTRRDVTIAPYDVMADNSKIGQKITNLRDGKFRCDWVANPSPSSSLYWGVDWPIIRYSDVLLMFAEADNELNGTFNGSPGYNAFVAVRKRAYSGDVSLIGTIPTGSGIGPGSFFQAIVRERSLEFGGEGIRKYDLKRWGLLGTALTETQTSLNYLGYSLKMRVPSYMAPPPTYTITGPLPTSLYFYYPGTPGNLGSDAKDDASFWMTTKTGDVPFYSSNISTPNNTYYPPSTAYPISEKVGWVAGPSTNTCTGVTTPPAIVTGFTLLGSGFVSGKSELFPIPQAVIDASNGKVKQNKGY